jgi:chemotaxis protein CheX
MDAKYINPFVVAMVNSLETMLNITPERGQPYLKKEGQTQGDISAIIGFAGPAVTGSVALSLPTPVALKFYSLMMGEKVYRITNDVQDTVGELANIIAGGAKAELSKEGITFNISIPTVVVGPGHTISHRNDIPVMVIPFEIGKHRFVLEVTMKLE